MSSSPDEDGRAPIVPSTGNDQNAVKGKMMLTLCRVLDGYDGYPHAVIPFAESYEIACQQAMRMFQEHLKDTDRILLKYAMPRRNGTNVWSTITEDDWRSILREDGEEIGVFMPGKCSMPYDLSRRSNTFNNSRIHLSWAYAPEIVVLVCTDSLRELRDAAWSMCNTNPVTTIRDPAAIRFSLRNPTIRSREVGNSGALKYHLTNLPQPLQIHFR